MFGRNRWNSIDDVFSFQHEVDRLFNQFWSELPTRSAAGVDPSFKVNATDEGWRVDIPLPGIDPKNVSLEVSGNKLTLRAETPSEGAGEASHYQQSFAIPQFLDTDKMSASHQHGMLRLTLPLKESVKPRRVQIETQGQEQKHLTGAR